MQEDPQIATPEQDSQQVVTPIVSSPQPGVPQAVTPTQYAGFFIRLAALMIDSTVFVALLFGFSFGFYSISPESRGDYYLSILFISTGCIYFLITIFFLEKYGATLGKMSLGLKIIKNGSIPNLKTSTLREGLKFILSSTFPLNLSFILIAFDKEKQGLHDKIANTIVVIYKPLSSARTLFAVLALIFSLLFDGIVLLFLFVSLAIYPG